VNRGQQHLVPTPDAVWKIVVLLYDLKVAPVDALFGSNVHGTVDLKFPDGTVQTESIDAASPTLGFASLPRGNYELRLHTAGLGAPTPVALSRDQTASIRVITFVDLGILGSVMLAGVASLLWIGRRQQIFASAGWMKARAGVWSSGAARSMSRGVVSGAGSLISARAFERSPSSRRSTPLRQAHPTTSSPQDGGPHTLTQGGGVDVVQGDGVDNGGEALTSGRRLAAQVAAMVGAPPIVDGQPEPSIGVGTLGTGAEPLAPPAARFCRRCGNRMPDGKGVCPRCAMGLNVRR
jgi:hypothetical protein